MVRIAIRSWWHAHGGQRIYVVPKTGLVAVITAGNYNTAAGSRVSEQAFWRYIFPATQPR